MIDKKSLPTELYTIRVGGIITINKNLINSSFDWFDIKEDNLIIEKLEDFKLNNLNIIRAYSSNLFIQFHYENNVLMETLIFVKQESIHPVDSDEWDVWLNPKSGLLQDNYLNAPDGNLYLSSFGRAININGKTTNMFEQEHNREIYILIEHVNDSIQPYKGVKLLSFDMF